LIKSGVAAFEPKETIAIILEVVAFVTYDRLVVCPRV